MAIEMKLPPANQIIYKPCPAGHLNPQVHTDPSTGVQVVMCRVPNCGWCAPAPVWNNRAPPKLVT